jgi:hypothetical protein
MIPDLKVGAIATSLMLRGAERDEQDVDINPKQ